MLIVCISGCPSAKLGSVRTQDVQRLEQTGRVRTVEALAHLRLLVISLAALSGIDCGSCSTRNVPEHPTDIQSTIRGLLFVRSGVSAALARRSRSLSSTASVASPRGLRRKTRLAPVDRLALGDAEAERIGVWVRLISACSICHSVRVPRAAALSADAWGGAPPWL